MMRYARALEEPQRRIEELRLDPVAVRLADLLGREVNQADDCIAKRPTTQLAGLANLYIHDAFAAAHMTGWAAEEISRLRSK